MRLFARIVGLLSLFAFLASFSFAATITGSVKGPDGKAFKGAFIEAQNQKTKVTVIVLSDSKGHYRAENLPAGDYHLKIRAVGYRATPQNPLSLTADQNDSIDIALQKGMVRWADLSIYQGIKLLPDGTGKKQVTGMCFACHGFETRMAAVSGLDESAWRAKVNYMRTSFGYFLKNTFSDQDYNDITAYLSNVFGPDSPLPKSPADLPQYQEVKTPEFSDPAMKIAYVTYELPGPNRFPGTGRPDKDGNVWIWTYNRHQFAKLDPKTAQVTEYQIPELDYAANHSVVKSPDGSVWFSEQAQNAIGKLDPVTGKITIYHDDVPGNRHTLAVDSKGVVWATGGPFARFDPKTGKFTNYLEIPNVYGVAIDQQDNAWFSEFKKNGQIGKVDVNTGNVTKFTPPTADSYPRRMKIDSQGLVWFAEYRAGQIASFDPKTATFKEYPLPGPSPTPYALEIDRQHHVWYSSMDTDVLGELDPATSKVTEYPFPHSENGIRDFFMDAEGHLWWGSQPNNDVGYFYLTASAGGERAASDRPQAPEKKTNNKDHAAPANLTQE